MKQLRKTFAAAVLGGAMLVSSAFADTVMLNPSATNAGAVNGSVLSPAYGPFSTDKATTSFASMLTIGSTPGTTTPSNFTERGYFLVESFSGVNNFVSGVTGGYNIYALFTITGSGAWTGATYNVTSANVTAQIYGSPGSSPVSVTTPTAGNPFGLTADSADFLLGTATFSGVASGSANLLPGNGATTSFTALLNFAAAPGTTGNTGFWRAPNPFNVNLSTSATGTAPTGGSGTTYTVSGGNTVVTTNVTAAGTGSGSGNIIFAINAVPEPGSLALVGLALCGVGVARRYARRPVTA